MVHPIILRSISSSVYVFAVIIGILAIVYPYAKTTSLRVESEIYVDKVCVNINNQSKCMSLTNIPTNVPDDSFLVDISTTLYALFVIFIILSGVCFILCVTNVQVQYVNSSVGLLLFIIAIATLITLIVAVTHKYLISTFDFTSTSILMIIACCFMIIKQVFANNVLRSIPSMIMRK